MNNKSILPSLTNLLAAAGLVASVSANAATLEFRGGQNILLDSVDTGEVYNGVHDAELRSANSGTNFNTGTGGGNSTTNFELRIDGNSGGGIAQAVMRFDNIFGNGPNQIAYGSIINSATLFFDIDNRGDDILLVDLLDSFGSESTVTWDSVGGGVRTTGVNANALSTPTATINGQGNFTTVSVQSSLEAWSLGTRQNHGWAFLPTGNDGVDIDASELNFPSNAPLLTVDFTTVPPAAVPLPSSVAMLLPAIGFVFGVRRSQQNA